jgi:tRNA nucleotidyltransferase (CCA-adding enzyme)
MVSNINTILKEVLARVNPSGEELNSIDKFLKSFISELEKKLKELKADAEVFIGGSFAKKTMIKKGQYDIDIFVRFGDKHKEEDISNLTEKALKKIQKKIILIHGSRDYFKINADSSFFIEIIPVRKVKNPKQAENITDLSYFHVNYIKKKLRTEKILEDVKLAKAFCHANKCYGAESYINGFSGYALELLVHHYGGFLNFLKAITKIKDKELIDIERLYKNKQEIKMDMNSAKMGSPIVLIDPTYKERNALAALSNETFEQFKIVCRNFLKKPNEKAFEIKEADLGKIRKNVQKNTEFILIKAETDKQEGDVAGSKLIKFYKHLEKEIGKLYKVSNRGFEYHGEKEAEYFFVVKSKGEIIQRGPNLTDKENVAVFRRCHKNVFVKGKRIYSRDKAEKKIERFIEDWKSKNSGKMREMHIMKLEVIKL